MRLALMALALAAMPASALAEPDLSGFWNLAFDGQSDPALLAKLPPDTVVLADTGAPEFPRMEFGGLKLKPAAIEHART